MWSIWSVSRHEARERHRQTGRGEREEHVIDVVRAREHRIALVAEEVPERDLIDEAQNLHDDDAHGQDRGAVQIVLALMFRHAFPPRKELQIIIIYAKQRKSK